MVYFLDAAGLMALLFVGGIMNLYWIIGLTLYVLLEKLIPTKSSINVGKRLKSTDPEWGGTHYQWLCELR